MEGALARDFSAEVTTNTRGIVVLLVVSLTLVWTTLSGLAPLLVELAAEFHTTLSAVGQLATATTVGWFGISLVVGPLLDGWGRRPVLLAGLGILSLANLASALAWDYWSLFDCRVLLGVGAAMIGPTVYATLGDHFPPAERGKVIGFSTAGISLAGLAGVPLTALVAAASGWRWTFGLTGAVGALVALVAFVFLPASPPVAATGVSVRGAAGSFVDVLTRHSAGWLYLANLMQQAAFWTMNTYLASFLMLGYGITLAEVAPVMFVVAAGSMLGALLSGIVADRFRQERVCALAQAIAAGAALPLLWAVPGLAISSALGGVFTGMQSVGRTSFMSMLTRLSVRSRGATMGLQAVTNSSAAALGAGGGGLALAVGGYSAVGLFCCAAALTAVAIYARRVAVPAVDGL